MIIIELIFNALLILVLLRWKRGIASEIKFVEKYLVYKINLFIFALSSRGNLSLYVIPESVRGGIYKTKFNCAGVLPVKKLL